MKKLNPAWMFLICFAAMMPAMQAVSKLGKAFAADIPFVFGKAEFAWTVAAMDRLTAGRDMSLFIRGTWMDYIFLLLYPLVFYFGLRIVAIFSRVRVLMRAALWLAPVMLLAGLFDAIENAALLKYAYGDHADYLLKISGICAGIKFGILAVGFVVFVFGVLSLLGNLIKR